MILIYFPENNLKPVGGPAGYLYNLREYLNYEGSDYEFLTDGSNHFESKFAIKIKKYVPVCIKRYLRRKKDIKYISGLPDVKKKVLQKYNLYDAIHFHSTVDLFMCRDFLKKYKGKVVLTSHSPCAPHVELEQIMHDYHAIMDNKLKEQLIKMDEYAFRRADAVIFPCVEAEEPYFNTWQEYNQVRDVKKLYYCTTGINRCSIKVGRSEIRKQLGIPEHAFVISYAGRHTEIKGYDQLKTIGERILKLNSKVYFLIAGKENPLKGLKNPRWIEYGWTNDPHSLIAASDLFVLPNKETYFDLILLEVMSLGVPVLMSHTGGNNYFVKYNSESLKIYKTIQEAVQKIEEFIDLDVQIRNKLGQVNLQIFLSDFTTKQFADKYKVIMKKIVMD